MRKILTPHLSRLTFNFYYEIECYFLSALNILFIQFFKFFDYTIIKNGLMKLMAGFLLMRKKQNFGEKINEKFIYFTLSCPLY